MSMPEQPVSPAPMQQAAPPVQIQQQQAPQAPQEPIVNLLSPELQLVGVPQSYVDQALQSGFQQPSPEDIHNYVMEQKYGSGTEIAKTFAEGAGRGATFGLSTGLQRLAGTKPEDIEGRKEVNPGAAIAGELTGLIGSQLSGYGEGALLARAGAAGAARLGFQGTTALSRVGSAAVRGAIETGLYQGGDEIHKMFIGDPRQTVGTALGDIGLATLLGAGVGGAFGTTSELWKATVGQKAGNYLSMLQRRANGEAIPLPADLEAAVKNSGVELPAEIRSALSGSPDLQQEYHALLEASTQPGLNMQKAVDEFKGKVKDKMLTALGHSDETLPTLSEISKHDAGKEVIDTISKSIEERFKPISEGFNAIRAELEKVPLTATDDVLADRLANLAEVNKWTMFPDSAEAKMFNDVLKGLPNLKTIEDLRLAQSKIWKMAEANDLWAQGGQMVRALRDVETAAMERAAGVKGTDTLMKLQLARSAYGTEAEAMNELASKLRIRGYRGPESMVEILKEAKPESIIDKLNPSKDATLIEMLGRENPEVLNRIRKYYLDNVIAKSVITTAEGRSIRPNTLYKALDTLPPETKNFLFNKEMQNKIGAARKILDAFPEHRSSNTAKWRDLLEKHMPAGAAAGAAMLLGHNPGVGFLIGEAARWLGRDVPDAIRLGLLKFLGHAGPVEPAAFKTLVDFAVAARNGEQKLNKGISSIFKAGKIVWSTEQLPSDKEKSSFMKKLESFQTNPEGLMNVGGDTGYYLPEQQQELSKVAVQAVNYLNSQKPNTDKPGVLDANREPSQAEKAQWDRTLNTALAPLSILQHVKDGTLLPSDIATLQNTHPGLYDRMAMKMLGEIAEQTSKGQMIPYQTRLGLSMFMNQPLDYSMQPSSILQNQAQPKPTNPQVPQVPMKHRSAALTKLPNNYLSVDQARSMKKASLS